MTIQEYREVLVSRLTELEKELVKAKARVEVADEMIAIGVVFTKNENEQSDYEEENDTEVVEPEEETELDGNFVTGV